jgi:mannitol-1-/sugar-/sorbitol-6-/2-deoxyglucose-6-phosphatase
MTTNLEAALFDLDGLLVDSEPLWHEAEIRVLRTHGVPLTVEMCRETKGRYVSEAVRHWHDRYPWEMPDIDVVVADILDTLEELIMKRLELKPGAEHAVVACRRRGLRLAVASSAPLRIISSVLARFGLEEMFERVCSAEHEAAGKPDPAVFLTAARLLGVDPERCVVFEDSLAGVRAAKTAGMICVAVPETRLASEASTAPDHRSAFVSADVVLTSLAELDETVWSLLELGAGRSVRVLSEHRSSARPPIVVSPGDDLAVGERDDVWPAFVLVTTSAGSEGWVPSRLLRRTADGRATPVRAYDTTELEVDQGELLTVIEADLGSGWLRCSNGAGREGWLPVRCVEPS